MGYILLMLYVALHKWKTERTKALLHQYAHYMVLQKPKPKAKIKKKKK